MAGARVGRRIGGATGLLLVLLAALGGLFAMHGMSDHGLGGAGEMSATSSAVRPSMTTPTPSLAVHEGDSRGQPSPGPGHTPDMVLGCLCLAVLVAGLVLLVGLMGPGHRAPPGWLPRRVVGPAPLTTRGAAKPPDRFALSILRC